MLLDWLVVSEGPATKRSCPRSARVCTRRCLMIRGLIRVRQSLYQTLFDDPGVDPGKKSNWFDLIGNWV